MFPFAVLSKMIEDDPVMRVFGEYNALTLRSNGSSFSASPAETSRFSDGEAVVSGEMNAGLT